MRKLLALTALVMAVSAWAGDKLLGVILVSDAGTTSNATTGYLSAGCSHEYDQEGAGACAQAFRIPAPALLSIQCKDQGAYVVVNKRRTDAGEGIKLAADQFLTSSTGATGVYIPAISGNNNGVPDGGTYVGGVVAIAPTVGNSRAECNVYVRQGNE